MGKSVIIDENKLNVLKQSEITEAAPEVDEYEIGAESDNPPVGGNGYHINESATFDSSEIGAVNYSWDFDEDEYQEWLQEAEYENTQESLMEYINDNVEFELEYLDNETYHTCGTDYVDYETLEDMFGSKMQNEILTTCINDGSGSFETVNLYSDDDVDVNNKDSINNMAMKLLRHGDYFKDCRGFILTNGVVVYTESEHNEICRIPNINNKFDFIRMGNIRVLPQSIDIGDKPTSEQRDVLRRAIASYADEELYLDIYQGKSSIGAHYIHPDWRYVMGEIDRFYSEGIKPQGNEYYESKNSKKQIVENKYDDLFNKAHYDLQYFQKQCKEKYGVDDWYISSWMEKTHPEISVDPKDVKIYTALNDKLHKIAKLWNDEDNKEGNEKSSQQPIENYDVISLAIEEFGLTSRLSQAGYILPDGKLLNFGNDGDRDTDHRAIEGIYKRNGIKIWNDEYRYNYVVDFMNHGAIRCDVNSGLLDMTKEPTNEQFYTIKDFVRNAVDVDIDFTDDKGNTLHSVSYSDAKPQAVVADIMRYYEDGIKPIGNVRYEAKDSKKVIKEGSEIYSKNFKDWFGDWEKADRDYFWEEEDVSKVVDNNLMPKIVKHGTPNTFKTFDLGKAGSSTDAGWLGTGFYFYGDNDYGAYNYAGYNGRVMECYLNIRNPYIACYEDKERLSELNTKKASDDFREKLIEDGYDGVFYNDDLDEEWVAFWPEQIREINSFSLNENLDFEVDSSEIDLSSFKKKHELVPNIWKPDGKLDSRIRLKLLDIADDFWKYVNLTWVEPSGIILTGSICNFNWSQYSDIDLHLIVDFDEIDEKTEFVRDYLDVKKNEWNNEHSGLQIMGYQVELYVQNLGEMPESNGIYDLEENDWIKEPNPDDIKSIGLNKFSIKDKAAKIMTIIDDMYDTLASTDDLHQIEKIGDDANYLWKKVKNMRKNSLEKNGESGSGNIVYKYMRRQGYLDKLWNLRTMCYDKSNSITESKNKKKKYTVYINGKRDDTFSDKNWKRKPEVGKGFYCGGAVFKIKKVTDDSVYAIEESKFNDKEIIREYLEKDYNLPLYKYYKWAKTASSCEKAKDLAYSCSYFIDKYIKQIYFRYSEFENLLDDDEFDYEDEEKIETFCKMLEENNLCDHFISIMQDIVNTYGCYNELPSWCHMDFNRIVKNEWCIHFTKDAESIAKYGFTGGTPDIDHLAYTNAGQEKPSKGYDFAFLIDDRSVDYNEYGDEAVIFRTSGIEIYHYGDNQNQVIFWGPNVKSFIPIHQDNGDWVVYGRDDQVLVRKESPSEIAVWATENLPQYRKQIMTGKNGYIPKYAVYDKTTYKPTYVPYPLYKNESIKKYLTLLKENFINEETVADGSSTTNPYKDRWKAEREALKNFVCNFGTVMQSKEDDKNGKLYKVFYDRGISQLIGYNYALCVQWDEIQMKPKSIVYIRAMDKFTPNIRRNIQYDTRGFDNTRGTYDDLKNYGNI